MNRHFHIVEYATPSEVECEPIYNLNATFTLTAKTPGSPLFPNPLYDFYFHTFDFRDNRSPDVFGQKFEELNPMATGKLSYKIFPDIRITMPVGFMLDIVSTMPGVKVKHVMCRKHPGKYYRWEDIITIRDRHGNEQDTRIVGSPNYYNMVSIDQIEFDVEPDGLSCTPEGIILTYDQYPETDYLRFNFHDLYKERNTLHCDHPDLTPLWDPETQYRQFHVIRNATLYNYMF